ncbi:hypothetical protein ACHAWC_004959 [Mediolabrus comicus]
MVRTNQRGGGGRGGGGGNKPAKKSNQGQGGGSRRRYSGGGGGGGNKGRGGGGGGRGDGGRRGGGRGGRGKNEKQKPATAEELDAAMDDYWMKSDNKELVEKKLNDDMDDYWAKKGDGEDAAKDGEEEDKPAAEEVAKAPEYPSMSQSSQHTLSQNYSQPDKDALAAAQAEVDNDGLYALQDFALLKQCEDRSIQLLALLPINDSVSLGSNPKKSDVVVQCRSNANGPIFVSNKAAEVECNYDDENGIKITITGYNRYDMMKQNDQGRMNSFHTRFRLSHEKKGKKTLERGTASYSLAHGTCIEHIYDGEILSQILLYVPQGYKEYEIEGEFYYRREEEDTEESKLRDDMNRFSQEYLSQHLSQDSTEFMAQGVDRMWKRYTDSSPRRKNLSRDDFIKKLLSLANNDDEGVDGGVGRKNPPSPPPPHQFRQGDGDDPVKMLLDILGDLGKQSKYFYIPFYLLLFANKQSANATLLVYPPLV